MNFIKGKTWEQAYGKEKSDKMKANLSIINKEKFKGTLEERYSKEKAQQIKEKISNKSRRTYEERMGIEKASEVKKLKSLQMIERNKSVKGKSNEEIYGIEKAKEMKIHQHNIKFGVSYEQKYGKERAGEIRQKKIEKQKKWTQEKIVKAYKEIVLKHGQILRSEIVKFARKKLICYEQAIISEIKSLNNLENLSGIKFKDRPFYGRVGKNEKLILDMLEKIISHKILRDYHILGRWVDGYIPELNIVIEIDENYHNNRKIEDNIRDQKIKEQLNCKIIRINEKEFLDNVVTIEQ